jgi:hypothetical protein
MGVLGGEYEEGTELLTTLAFVCDSPIPLLNRVNWHGLDWLCQMLFIPCLDPHCLRYGSEDSISSGTLMLVD